MKKIVLFLAATIALAGCTSTSGVSTTAATPGGSKAKGKPAVAAKAAAHVGSAIVLKGDNGEQMTVTLTRVAATTRATDGFSTPDAGNRYFAAQVKLTNSGTAAYDDSPSNGAKALDSQGQQFDATIVDTIAAGPQLPAAVKIGPGSSALGYLTFQVPAASRITGIQFSLSSGFGNTGEWKIP
jgi:uncharacterized protein YceK